MTAVSSVRPLHECSKTRERTLAAHRTWLVAFDHVYYFGSQSSELVHPKVRFLMSEQFPRIVEMIEHCASITGWSCIINGDIVVDKSLKHLDKALTHRGAVCAVSRRYEINGTMKSSKIVDNGLDFFAATPAVWKKIGKEFPEQYRIGHNRWDTLMLGAFNCIGQAHLYDLTPRRVIYHPSHAERRQPVFIGEDEESRFWDYVSFPYRKL